MMRTFWLCLIALFVADISIVSNAPLYDNEVEELLDGHDWPEVQQQLRRMHVTAEMKTLYMTDAM